MRRAAYLVAFAVLALAAAALVVRAQRTVSVLVATRDLHAGAQVQPGDVQVVRLPEDAVPGGALSAAGDAVGRWVDWPLTSGEPVLGRLLRAQRSGGAALAGLDIPPGFRAVAVPVQPAAAVGGTLAPGDRVDVFATPQPGHAEAGSSLAAAAATGGGEVATVELGHDVLVLQLRSDQGEALDAGAGDTVHGLNFGVGKLGSVVLAVPETDVRRYASAVAADTIYLALSVS